jgi:hypothetical protein
LYINGANRLENEAFDPFWSNVKNFSESYLALGIEAVREYLAEKRHGANRE